MSALLSRHSDAATVQVVKAVYINGAPQGISFHETDEFTLYPASIISVNKNRFTKHYFIGDKRIASRIGSGSFDNVYGQNGSFLTAGQQDYAERLNQIETQLVETKSWTTELETVGIIGNRKYTENKLRKEHKLNKRVKY